MQQSLKINNDIFQIQKQNLEFDLDSQVYLGTNSQTNEEVTIRFCSIDQAELQILQNIHKSKKENLIEIKHIELRKENQQIIVMEPIIENFYSFMTGNEIKTLSKEQKNILFYQMVLSVKDLHELGYIHRDIKPENFCLIKNNSSSEITVKLFNFSLSKYNSDRIKTLNVGSPLYVAPDVIKQPDYGFSIDLWSLGCVWFELLTGDTFFKGIIQIELLLLLILSKLKRNQYKIFRQYHNKIFKIAQIKNNNQIFMNKV